MKARPLLRRVYLILGLLIIALLLSQLVFRPRVLRHSLASGYFQLRRFAPAERIWSAAASEDGDHIPENSLGKIRYRQGQHAEAERLFAGAARENEQAPGTQYDLGNALYRTNKLEEALQAFKAAMLLDPDDQDAKANYELVLNRQGYQPPPPPREGDGGEEDKRQEPKPEPDSTSAGDERRQQYRNALEALDQKEALDRMARRRERESEKGAKWW